MPPTSEPLIRHRPKHLRGTEDANVVQTPDLQSVTLGLKTIAEFGGVITVDGAPGLGKTMASDLVYQELSLDGHWVTMPHQPRNKETTAYIHTAVTGSRVRMRSYTEYEMFNDITDCLNGRHVILAIDEAQHLTSGALHRLRYLYDQPENRLVLLLVGAGLNSALTRRCEALANRVERHVNFKPYSRTRMAKFLKEYHPLFASADADAAQFIINAANGNLRNAATLLKSALSLGADPNSGLDLKTARAAVVLTTGGAP